MLSISTDFISKYRNYLALTIMLFSIILLIPGLTQPILTIKAEVVFFGRTKTLLHDTRSIWDTVLQFKNDGHFLVAGLIFLFSIFIPFLKLSLFIFGILFKKGTLLPFIHQGINAISKWAMADVFVVGLWILFLSANTMDAVSASMGSGFYYFTGYCLMSILGFQSYKINHS